VRYGRRIGAGTRIDCHDRLATALILLGLVVIDNFIADRGGLADMCASQLTMGESVLLDSRPNGYSRTFAPVARPCRLRDRYADPRGQLAGYPQAAGRPSRRCATVRGQRHEDADLVIARPRRMRRRWQRAGCGCIR